MLTDQSTMRDLHQEPRLAAGVVGLGMIGGGVAVSLSRRGIVPTVFDVRPHVSDDLAGVPTQVATPADVAEASDVVLIAVVDAAQAREALIGPDGLLTVHRDGLVVVLLSTVSVASVHELAALCSEHGATLLDAGVTGGLQAADNGLVTMVGGPQAIVERVMPVLEGFSASVVHCGPLGAGMVTKLARNVLTYSSWAAVREATSIADAAGVHPEQLLAVLENEAGGTAPLNLLRARVAGAQASATQVAAADHLAQKDLAAAQEFAASVGLETPIVDVARPRMGAVYRGELPAPLPTDRRARGLEMMDRVYGEGFAPDLPEGYSMPSLDDIIDHLFAEIWSRPHLTVRDRRLMVIGATSMLGRQDLLEVQLRGGIAAGELTHAQLREVVLILSYYAGIGNGTAVQGVVEKLIAEVDQALVS